MEKERERNARWARNNPEKIREKTKRHIENNKDKESKRKQEYRKNNKEKVKLSMQRWEINNRDKRIIISHNYRAKIFNSAGNGLTLDQWNEIKESYSYRCAYCNEIKPLSADHIVPLASGGRHDIDNIVPTCQSCNSSKGKKSLLMFLRYRLIHDVI